MALSRRALTDWCDIFSEDGEAYLFGAQWHNATYFLPAGSASYDQQAVREDIVQLTEKLALFLVFVLALYAVGMAVAVRLGNNAFAEVRRTYETRVSALAGQLDAELQRIQSQIYYTMLRADVQYMALVTPSMSFPDIYKNVSAVAELMYALHNSSGLRE